MWSGSPTAALLDMRFKWAFPAIFVGNLIAGILIMILSHGVVSVIGGWTVRDGYHFGACFIYMELSGYLEVCGGSELGR